MNKEYLFVYGTLRREFGLALMQELADDLGFIGVGEIKAALYDLGNYPGAAKGTAAGTVKGEVFEIGSGKNVLDLLDKYEGDDYSRGQVKVTMEKGKELDAWLYWFTGTVDETRRIQDGDYLLYLKNKKERLA